MEDTLATLFSFLICIGFLTIPMIMIGILFFLSYKTKLDNEFEFIIDGKNHSGRFIFDPFFGMVTIMINGDRVKRAFKFINGNSEYKVKFGENNEHELLFKLIVPLIYGAYRKKKCEVIINSEHITTLE